MPPEPPLDLIPREVERDWPAVGAVTTELCLVEIAEQGFDLFPSQTTASANAGMAGKTSQEPIHSAHERCLERGELGEHLIEQSPRIGSAQVGRHRGDGYRGGAKGLDLEADSSKMVCVFSEKVLLSWRDLDLLLHEQLLHLGLIRSVALA